MSLHGDGQPSAERSQSDGITIYRALAEKEPGLSCILGPERAALAPYATDFGRTTTTYPDAALVPRTIDEVKTVLRFAQTHRIPVALRGAGHAASRLTLRSAGMVVDMRGLGNVLQIDEQKLHIDIEGGASWGALLQSTLARGLVPLTTVDWQTLTVGGTISTGGVGVQAFWAGVHADQVLEFDLIMGTGEIVRASAHENADIFDLARGGLGHAGAIVRARMPLMPAPSHVQVFEFFYATAAEVFKDLELVTRTRDFDTLHIVALPHDAPMLRERLPVTGLQSLRARAEQSPTPQWIFRLEAGRYRFQKSESRPLPTLQCEHRCTLDNVLSLSNFLFRTPPLMRNEELAQGAHPELILFVPEQVVEELVNSTLRETSPADMGGGPVLLLPIWFGAVNAPQFRVPSAPRGFMFSLLRVAPLHDVERQNALTEANIRIYERALKAGAVRYPCDALPIAAFDEARLARYAPLRKRLDPNGILIADHTLTYLEE